MNVPPREALLDIEWLVRTHAAEGYEALLLHARSGAEVYDGPVTAVAEAVLRLRWLARLPRLLDGADVRHGLAHAFASGSWSPEPDGPRMARSCWQWLAPAFPPDKRAEFVAKYPPCEPPPLPSLRGLRLVDPLDCAWVGHTAGIWGCEVSRDGRYMVSASRDGDVAVWDMQYGTLVARGRSGEPEVRDCAVTPDCRRVVSVHASGRITIWDLSTMVLLSAFAAPPFHDLPHLTFYLPRSLGGSLRRRRRIAISPGGSLLAVAGRDAVEVWDLDRVEPVTTLHFDGAFPYGLLALAFCSDTNLVTVASTDPIAVLTWDLTSRTIAARGILESPTLKQVSRAIVAADQQFLVASGSETTVWRLDTPTPVATVPHGAAGQAVALSLDATLLATSDDQAAGDGTLRVWSLPDLQEIHSWTLRDFGCRDIATTLAFAPNGRQLVVGGWEGVLRRLAVPTSAESATASQPRITNGP